MDMKTDIEKMKELFDELKIGYKHVTHRKHMHSAGGGSQVLLLIAGISEQSNIIGYLDFYTEYHFDDEGKFLKVGIWE
jgi:hypothetical protein